MKVKKGRLEIRSGVLQVGKILGIPIGLHYTWFLIAVVVTWLLAVNLFPDNYPGWPKGQYLIVAGITSILFFGSVLAHELGHSVAAMRYGIAVHGITLFVFGGVAKISRDPDRPRDEMVIAVAGPVVSFLLGAAFLGIFFLLRESNQPVAALTLYLGQINILLALFNMIPGFPLDGGRIFRAVVWSLKGDFSLGTKIAANVGKGIGYLFIIAGIIGFAGPALNLWEQSYFNGLWLAFIGWFLQSAASQGITQVTFRDRLRGVSVRELMRGDLPVIPKRLDLRTLVENHTFYGGHRVFLVGEGATLEGSLSLDSILKIPRERWVATRAGDVMAPMSHTTFVRPEDEVLRAMELMEERQLSEIPVREAGEIVGVVGREAILNFLHARAGA